MASLDPYYIQDSAIMNEENNLPRACALHRGVTKWCEIFLGMITKAAVSKKLAEYLQIVRHVQGVQAEMLSQQSHSGSQSARKFGAPFGRARSFLHRSSSIVGAASGK